MNSDNNNSIIAKVNEVFILVLENEKLVPIKPICDALGIDDKSQRNKINEDDILSSVGVLSTSTGSDGKEYKMFCLPLKFVFGWLFSINHKNVKAEAQDAVKKYKLECYNALYDHFSEYGDFIEQRQKSIEEQLGVLDVTKSEFKNAKVKLQEAQEKLNEARKMNFNDWKASKQMEINFSDN